MARTDGRDAMVLAAERLVAEQGLAGATLREVQAAAGQRNKSAAQYHFGNREGLLAAVIEHRMAPVNADRLARLGALERDGAAGDLHRLVAIYVTPLAEATAHPGSAYARFLAQVVLDPGARQVVNEHLRAESSRRVLDRIAKVLPDVPKPLRDQRIARFVSTIVTTLGAWEREPPRGVSRRAAVADLIGTCAAMLAAPHPQEDPCSTSMPARTSSPALRPRGTTGSASSPSRRTSVPGSAASGSPAH